MALQKPLLDLIESVLAQGGRYQAADYRVIFTDARGNRWDVPVHDAETMMVLRTAELLQ